MKALKALVIFMTVLLVAGLGLLGWGLATKGERLHRAANAPAAALPATASFGDVAVPLPAGARIEQMAVVGNRVVLRITAADAERLVVLDPAAGRVDGQFILVPGGK